jgi:hypothetical protein
MVLGILTALPDIVYGFLIIELQNRKMQLLFNKSINSCTKPCKSHHCLESEIANALFQVLAAG